eukprot:TRINITY_DN847_c0_g1_i3.p1 TRINITY_DN847_c0_g1~~TRINITY_DN847_c0_g1_i3.p1  ORF type:complete len:381 (+),score=128.37 TRINITY_DN847_c0_g1_i3:72-1214(+)
MERLRISRTALCGMILASELVIVLAQSDCEVQLASVQANLDAVNVNLGNIKQGVKIAAIVVPILGGLLLILLGCVVFLLLRGVLKIKKKLPFGRDVGFIRFMRNLDKMDVDVAAPIKVSVATSDDEEEEEKRRRREKEEDEKERERNRKKKEEEESRSKGKKKDEEEDEDTKRRRRFRLDISGRLKAYIRWDDLELESRVLYRTFFYIVYKGKYKGEEVIYRKLRFVPSDEEDDEIAREIVEEDEKRSRMRSENDKHINKQVGTVASYPDFGFIVKYHQSGHLRKILMEDKKKYTEKELVKIALDVSEGINALHRLKLLARIVESRNVVIEGSGKDITALFDPDWEPECLTNEKEGSQNVYLGPVAWMAPEVSSLPSISP